MTHENLTSTIDAYGAISAQIAELEAQKAIIRRNLIEAIGEGAAEGKLFRVSISTTSTTRLDTKKVKALLPPDLLEQFSTTTETTTVKISARTGVETAPALEREW